MVLKVQRRSRLLSSIRSTRQSPLLRRVFTIASCRSQARLSVSVKEKEREFLLKPEVRYPCLTRAALVSRNDGTHVWI